eukprot:768514-Hanusia_phi.AAC.3
MPKVAHVCIVLYCLVEMLSALSPAHLHLVARLGRINSRTGLRLRGGDGETQADAKTNEAGEKLNEEKEEDSDKKQQKLQQMLWEGASEGDTMLVMQAYRSGANLLQKNEEGLNALHLACASGHLEVVQSILEECKDLSCTAGDGSTPLHLSVYYGFREIAQFLIENSADLSAVDHEGQIVPAVRLLCCGSHACLSGSTPLHNAAYRGLPEIITLLVEKGADVNAQQPSTWRQVDASPCLMYESFRQCSCRPRTRSSSCSAHPTRGGSFHEGARCVLGLATCPGLT